MKKITLNSIITFAIGFIAFSFLMILTAIVISITFISIILFVIFTILAMFGIPLTIITDIVKVLPFAEIFLFLYFINIKNAFVFIVLFLSASVLIIFSIIKNKMKIKNFLKKLFK